MSPVRYVFGFLLSAAPASAFASAPVLGDYPAPACTSSLPTSEVRGPVLVPPVHAGDTVVRILNQSPAATVQIQKLGTGPIASAPSKNGWEFNLPNALVAGEQVRVCQTHTVPNPVSVCGEWLTVESAPAALPAPRFVYVTVEAGARSVALAGVHPGAEVVITIAGVEHGRRWAGPNNAVSIPIDPSLAVGTQLVATQNLGGVTSPSTSKTLSSGQRPVNAPRILGPIQSGDFGVWVSNVTPGTLVEVVESATGVVIGSKEMGEAVGLVATCPINGSVYARAKRGLITRTGATVNLSSFGLSYIHLEGDFDFGTMQTSAGYSSVAKKGRWYGPWAVPPGSPVVFMIHGQQPGQACDLPTEGDTWTTPGFSGDSYLGYDYVAEALAAMGVWVFSIDVEDSFLPTYDRAQLLEEVVDDVLHSSYLGVTPDSPVGLFGHSLGGDAAMAFATNHPTWIDVRGVFAIAPASWGVTTPSIGLDPANGVPLLHLMGSEDYFFDDSFDALRSIQQYDTAWKSKTQVMLKGAGHNCFNRCWCLDDPYGNTLSESAHQEVVTLLAKPFFRGLLQGPASEWAPYFGALVRPRGLYRRDLTIAHHAPAGAFLIDNFGDPQTELTVRNFNLSTSVNARGGAITEVNAAAARQEKTHSNMESTLGVPYQAEHLPDDRSLIVKWAGIGWEYNSEIPAGDLLAASATDFLSFRVVAVAGAAANQFSGEYGFDQDLIVSISDGEHEGRVRAGAVGPVPYPYSDFDGDPVHVMATIRIPLDAFTAAAPDLDLSNLRRITFRSGVREEGRLIIDDLEVARD